MSRISPPEDAEAPRRRFAEVVALARAIASSCCCCGLRSHEGSERSIARQRLLLDVPRPGEASSVEVSASPSSRLPVQSASELKAGVSEPRAGEADISKDRQYERKCDSRMSLLDYDETCPTCLEAYTSENPKIVAKCGHHFHLPCIYDWLERSSTCPVCGRKMEFDAS